MKNSFGVLVGINFKLLKFGRTQAKKGGKKCLMK